MILVLQFFPCKVCDRDCWVSSVWFSYYRGSDLCIVLLTVLLTNIHCYKKPRFWVWIELFWNTKRINVVSFSYFFDSMIETCTVICTLPIVKFSDMFLSPCFFLHLFLCEIFKFVVYWKNCSVKLPLNFRVIKHYELLTIMYIINYLLLIVNQLINY